MNVVSNARKKRPTRLGRGRLDPDSDPSSRVGKGNNVTFYDELPQFELGLDDFEEYALARLKVLRKIEELKVRNITGDSYKAQLDKTIKSSTVLCHDDKDVASHFILRAAYCRTEDLRRWFLTHEVYLLKHRLESLSPQALERVVTQFNLKPLTETEKEAMRDKLLSVGGLTPAEFATTPFYAIPFQQALDLVSQRRCFIYKGLAHVPLSKIMSILLAQFRARLSRSLALASSSFYHVEEEDRIAPLLKSMNNQHIVQRQQYTDTSSGVEVTAQSIHGLVQHMPLCMRQLHAGLHQDSKLKHWGRLQYGLFLKGAGMSMQESLTFFQRAFSRIVTAEEFQKNYAYNIRHMHGKEGKRASYTPYSCTKIILGQAPTGAADHHGCPYKHYDEAHLGALLQKLKIGTARDRSDILQLKKTHNYQLACLKHFQVTHPSFRSGGFSMDNVGNHPNAWFQSSLEYSKQNNKQDEEAGMATTKDSTTAVSPEKMDTSK